ncbi:DNA alkylation repair protein [Pontibacter sp. G13]|uniref:DNA alkylation repair protein n=1 Tax=Pontibacter sp. G13 TaxID=3074898 RepID=UPI00288C166F|nr:DNA alkylation repair protein [Pontibacter sp. G13]WNJ17865.1 DNA alkylation repair protein [Pontibacter sp. G13]
MSLSPKAQAIYDQIDPASTKLGDLKKMAKEIKRDHDLALELWSSGEYLPRQLAVLVMDKNLLTQEVLDQLDADMQIHPSAEQTRMMEWLMANQLMKGKKTTALIESWADSPRPLQRRTFWYHQGRLRWTGKTLHENTSELLDAIESQIADEVPEVQWAMNFTAAWIGIFDEPYRDRCIQIGETNGLYKDEVVPKNCTPNYLPEFIRIEVGKRNQ